MANVTLRSVKGSDLTPSEVDANFTELNNKKLEPDASGNLGLGVTPSAWGTGFKSLQLPYGGLYSQAFTVVGTVSNAYNNGTNWVYYSTGQAVSRYEQSQGSHAWYQAAAGTAGNPITFTQAMTLDASGNLGVGVTAPTAVVDAARNQNGQSFISIFNNSAGTVAESTFVANNGTYIGSFGISGINKSAFGALLASDAYLFSNANVANTGIVLMANGANGVIKFASGGSAERGRWSSAGDFIVGTAALATTATAGFPWIPSCAGAPTGAPAAPYTNAAAMVVDTTNNRLYVRVGSTWRYASLI